ncbi:hypothetical protein [Streptomonospora arabica]|uniref:Phosphoribosyltransferase domain-containing protein n=1 Tax=Streptomonospora arabica TaxID=412417 RepID=A0ABV9SR90_9ACTN
MVTAVTYRVRGNQHDHDLRVYKAAYASEAAKTRLLCLFWHFSKYHARCVQAQAGVGGFTHVAFVPSTKTARKSHPLQDLLAPVVPRLSLVRLGVNAGVSPDSREFAPHWFTADPLAASGAGAPAVLLVDDTWVTGARAQSAAYRLKQAGAATVAVLVLARQINPDWTHSRPLLTAVENTTFDAARCVHHSH